MAKIAFIAALLLLVSLSVDVHCWSSRLPSSVVRSRAATIIPTRRQQSTISTFSTAAATVSIGNNESAAAAAAAAQEKSNDSESVEVKEETKQENTIQQLRKEGGIFAFNTKYGALNPYGIYYGLTAIALGLVWYVGLTACQLFYWVTRGRFDKFRRMPIFLSHVWGLSLMRLTGQTPPLENKKILLDFYKQNRAAMFVANHNSWMDIPYLGYSIGWKNYKIIAKKELEKVPILSKSLKVGGHIMVDRTNRRSQLKTLKDGIQLLKDGVQLCTFPEGTRSRSGRLQNFKNGAFKMAHKCGAPVIPLSIVGAGKVNPSNWMFPCRPGWGKTKVVIHDPVESEGITEDELGNRVRESIISGLPDDQRPLQK